jgi:hypothetical protein
MSVTPSIPAAAVGLTSVTIPELFDAVLADRSAAGIGEVIKAAGQRHPAGSDLAV